MAPRTLVLLLFCLFAGTVAAAGKPVAVAVAQQRELAPLNWYSGTVISRRTVQLSAEVEGRLLSVAEAGARVGSGDTVAIIDDTLLQQELLERRADIARTRARLDFLEKEARRLQRLARQNNAAQSQLEQVISDRAGAQAELTAARARERMTLERLQRTTLRAPFDGVIRLRLLRAGEWVDSGEAVVEIVDVRRLEVQGWVARQALSHLRPGAGVRLQSAMQQFKGEVRALVPVADPESRLYELRVSLPPGEWMAGDSVRIAVPAAQPRRVLAVPRDALVIRRGAIYVYRVTQDNVAERVEVRTGIADDAYIEVQGRLEAGDRVVIRGGERLRDGQTVIVQRAETDS